MDNKLILELISRCKKEQDLLTDSNILRQLLKMDDTELMFIINQIYHDKTREGNK